MYPLAELDPSPDLPLAHITLGTPGTVWPRQSTYSAFFSDPKNKSTNQQEINQAFDDGELDA